jgi:hypothetical protein
MGLDLKLTDATGTALTQQRGAVGHLKVKGASVLDRYYKAGADALDARATSTPATWRASMRRATSPFAGARRT